MVGYRSNAEIKYDYTAIGQSHVDDFRSDIRYNGQLHIPVLRVRRLHIPLGTALFSVTSARGPGPQRRSSHHQLRFQCRRGENGGSASETALTREPSIKQQELPPVIVRVIFSSS